MPSGSVIGAAIEGLSASLVGMINSALAAPLLAMLRSMEAQRFREVADPTDALFTPNPDKEVQTPRL